MPPAQHPLPVRPPIELVRQPADLRLLLRVGVEVGGAREHPGKKERRVDRRQLAVPSAATGLHVEEVVIEAAMPGGIRLGSLRTVAEEPQRPRRDLGSELAGDDAALDEDRNGREGEPYGRNAGRRRRVGLVAGEARRRIRLVQIVLKRRHLKAVQLLLGQETLRILVVPRFRHDCRTQHVRTTARTQTGRVGRAHPRSEQATGAS